MAWNVISAHLMASQPLRRVDCGSAAAVVRATQELYRARTGNPAAGRAAAASNAALSLPARAMLRQQQQLGPSSTTPTPAATTPEPFNTAEQEPAADTGAPLLPRMPPLG